MVATRPFISKSSNTFKNPSVTVSRAPITTDINVTFIFYSFFNSLGSSMYLFFSFLLFYSFSVFHISVSWLFSTGIWMTLSLQDS